VSGIHRRNTALHLLQELGPGLVTGAADDDPSGIATYSQAGARFGFGMLWTVIATWPLMVGIQSIVARIGRVTGRGLAANMRQVFPGWFVAVVVLLLLVANTVNLAADLSAMGAAVALVAPPAWERFYTVGFGVLSLLLQLFVPYRRYVPILKWLTLSLLAYVAVAFTVRIPWERALVATLTPQLSFDHDSAAMLVAVLGTTISPYLFFWQASQEVEEIDAAAGEHPLREDPAEAPPELDRIRADTEIGLLFTNLVFFFIVLTTAVTLHAAGVRQIDTAAQAANALRPIAGDFAFGLFALGIVGTGLLAVPVLAGSAAYAVSEALGWRYGLGRRVREAGGFYGVIAAATLGGLLLDFSPVDPIRALLWAAVINGVVSAPIMAVAMIVAARPAIMGPFVITPLQTALGWLATLVMAAAAVALFVV
jgi:Mn2+/Fe2+ NRAMP family transporter